MGSEEWVQILAADCFSCSCGGIRTRIVVVQNSSLGQQTSAVVHHIPLTFSYKFHTFHHIQKKKKITSRCFSTAQFASFAVRCEEDL
jgi:hypothetical protein